MHYYLMGSKHNLRRVKGVMLFLGGNNSNLLGRFLRCLARHNGGCANTISMLRRLQTWSRRPRFLYQYEYELGAMGTD